jgi:hypothetical protein
MKIAMIGTMVISDPVRTRLKIGSAATPEAWELHWLRPTVSGYQSGSLSMMSGRK